MELVPSGSGPQAPGQNKKRKNKLQAPSAKLQAPSSKRHEKDTIE